MSIYASLCVHIQICAVGKLPNLPFWARFTPNHCHCPFSSSARSQGGHTWLVLLLLLRSTWARSGASYWLAWEKRKGGCVETLHSEAEVRESEDTQPWLSPTGRLQRYYADWRRGIPPHARGSRYVCAFRIFVLHTHTKISFSVFGLAVRRWKVEVLQLWLFTAETVVCLQLEVQHLDRFSFSASLC